MAPGLARSNSTSRLRASPSVDRKPAQSFAEVATESPITGLKIETADRKSAQRHAGLVQRLGTSVNSNIVSLSRNCRTQD